MKITILGCGYSGGVPTIGNIWGSCNPANPKNRRRRSSVLVEAGDTSLLIDCGPDVREQMNDLHRTKLSAVIFTHGHSDHIGGVDDIRRFYFYNNKIPLPFYADQTTFDELHQRFSYVFKPITIGHMVEHSASVASHLIEGPFKVNDLEIIPFYQEHGPHGHSLGFRIGDFAYSTDVSALPEASFEVLAGVRLWVVDMLSEKPGASHSHLAQTLSWIERVKPDRAVLTHMNNSVDYADLLSKCPPTVEPAYDGMELEL
jgi:phosphoribosyl 1,2-cyclic phosphate phosphodiesterase